VITDNRLEGHNQSAILFADHPADDRVKQQDVLVANNKSIDDKAFATFYASVRVCVAGNFVEARVGGEAASAIYIGARNDSVVVQANKIASASGSGITVTDKGVATPDLSPKNVRILKNKVSNVQENGIDLFAGKPGQYEARGNKALNNRLVGLYVAATTEGAQLHRNTALGNGPFDCQDESTGGTGPEGIKNTWADNTGGDADPPVICAKPQDDDRHHDKPKHRNKKHKNQHHKKHRKKNHHGNKGSWTSCFPCRF
jgi:parallel beta helix pectate lyase-like protein